MLDLARKQDLAAKASANVVFWGVFILFFYAVIKFTSVKKIRFFRNFCLGCFLPLQKSLISDIK